MADERLELAYEAGVRALAQQDATLTSLRNRATGVLSAAALVASFAGGLGLVGGGREGSLPGWAAPALLLVLVCIGVVTMVVQWPIRSWVFGPDSRAILDRTKAGDDVDAIRLHVAEALTAARVANGAAILLRSGWYRVGVALLVVEVAALLVAIALNGTEPS